MLATIGLVRLSPLVLAALNPDGRADWKRLADIAQTYAAVSAVLALLALGGVVVSLVLQAREMRAAREQTLRVLHTELSRLALEDPLYLDCWGPVRAGMNDDQRRQHIYVNLIVSLWEMTYETGGANEAQISPRHGCSPASPVGGSGASRGNGGWRSRRPSGPAASSRSSTRSTRRPPAPAARRAAWRAGA